MRVRASRDTGGYAEIMRARTVTTTLTLAFCASSFVACSLPGSGVDDSEPKPNVILIYADDLGYGDLGCYGATKVATPNIDRLAQEGRLFTDAHSPAAVCSPSRYGLLTGKYPLRRNLWGPIARDLPLCIDTGDLTIARVMQESGYDTACVGKWHLGFGERRPDWNGELKPGPLELGFDYYFGLPVVNSSPPYVYVENHRVVGWDPADPIVRGRESVTQRGPEKRGYRALGGGRKAHELYRDQEVATRFKEKALAWMTRSREADSPNPFFLYLATTNIHHPFTPAARFVGTSPCGRYGDFIHELDWMVGEILDAIDDAGQKDNTLVIFTSDNGGMLNQGGQDAWSAGHRLNGELLGFKFGAWEGGHRVPFIARWPGRIPAGSRSDALIGQVDLLATLAAVVGRPLTKAEAPDSLNQLPTLLGSPPAPVRTRLIISPNNPSHLVVRQGRWVYIPAQGEGGFKGKRVGEHAFGDGAVFPFTGQSNNDFAGGRLRPDAPPGQLYDLTRDPGQTRNVHARHPEVVAELQAVLHDYRAQLGPEPPLGWIDRR